MTGPLTIAAAGLGLGLVVGLLGGGGGILAVPLLVYGVGLPPDEAITLSLIVVAVAALTGLSTHARAGHVRWRTGITFGLMGLAGAWLGALASARVSDRVLLGTLSLLLLLAAGGMLRPPAPPAQPRPPNRAVILVLATAVGFVVGFVGVGGGFLTVPALVIAVGLPVRDAIGTGLVVMAVNAVAGLGFRLGTGASDVDLRLAVPLAVAAGVGAVLGALWSRRLPSRALQVTFGLLAVAMAIGTAAEVAIT